MRSLLRVPRSCSFPLCLGPRLVGGADYFQPPTPSDPVSTVLVSESYRHRLRLAVGGGEVKISEDEQR